MSIETLNNRNEESIQENLKELKYEISKEQEKTKKIEEYWDKEIMDSIFASLTYENFLKDILEIKMSKNPKERKEKIKKIKEYFTKDGIILYQNQTWLVKEIKDINDFFNKVAKWEITIDFSIDVNQYVKEWAITLDKKVKKGIDKIKIKKIQLNANSLEENDG